MARQNCIILAGAGVVRDGVVDDLRDVVVRTNIGVFNSWAAKGLFQWDSPAHFGTVGLQRDDFARAQLADAEEIVIVGCDEHEAPRQLLDDLGITWREVATGELRTFTHVGHDDMPERPGVYAALAAVCGPLYEDSSVPLNPARAARDLSLWLPDDGFATADANICGFWLGRTFPTRHLGSVVLPTAPVAGFAATNALRASGIGQTVVVVAPSIDEATQSVIELAQRSDLSLLLELWTMSGPTLSSKERLEQLTSAHAKGGVQVVEVGVNFNALSRLVDVCGPPRVWGL